jgi:hypothetical protein
VPQVCTVCSHPESFAINEAIVVEKRSNRAIACQFGVGRMAVQRHREHVPELLVKASQAMEIAEADDLLARVEELYEEARRVLEAAKGTEDHRVVLAAIDRAGRQLELLAKLRDELNERPVVNVLVSPQWVAIRTAMMDALEPYTAARVAVAEKLLELEDGNGSGD